jgi:hypothetical protein
MVRLGAIANRSPRDKAQIEGENYVVFEQEVESGIPAY